MMLFDTHAHLNHNKFVKDRDETINRAKEAGVAYLLNVSYDERSINHSISISRKHPSIYAAIGVHPHYADEMSDAILEKIEKEYKFEKVIAIGEIGLDYHRNLSPPETQRECFIEQIRLAKKLKSPVIIHNRESNDDIVSIIKSENAGEYGGVVHSFSGDRAMLRDVLNAGMCVSFNGIATFHNTSDLREIIKITPLEKILIETDCPYLAPVPHRGQRNEPAYVLYVAQEIAKIKHIKVEDAAEATLRNALELFHIRVFSPVAHS